MNIWKKIAALFMSGVLILGISGCRGKAPEADDIEIEAVEEPAVEEPEETVEIVSDLEASITWWTYPVFVQDEGQEDGVYEQTLIEKFNQKYPNIQVNLRVLD